MENLAGCEILVGQARVPSAVERKRDAGEAIPDVDRHVVPGRRTRGPLGQDRTRSSAIVIRDVRRPVGGKGQGRMLGKMSRSVDQLQIPAAAVEAQQASVGQVGVDDGRLPGQRIKRQAGETAVVVGPASKVSTVQDEPFLDAYFRVSWSKKNAPV